jgi:hypothetical protein
LTPETSELTGLVTVFLAIETKDSPRRYIRLGRYNPEMTVAYKITFLIEFCLSTRSAAAIRHPDTIANFYDAR